VHVILATAIAGSYLLHELELFYLSPIVEVFKTYLTYVSTLHSPSFLSLVRTLFNHIAYHYHPL
jgi:hypothetical protein